MNENAFIAVASRVSWTSMDVLFVCGTLTSVFPSKDDVFITSKKAVMNRNIRGFALL